MEDKRSGLANGFDQVSRNTQCTDSPGKCLKPRAQLNLNRNRARYLVNCAPIVITTDTDANPDRDDEVGRRWPLNPAEGRTSQTRSEIPLRRSPEQRPPPRALPMIFVTVQAQKENGSPVRRHSTAGPESVSPTQTITILPHDHVRRVAMPAIFSGGVYPVADGCA